MTFFSETLLRPLALIYIAKATQWPEFLQILGLFTLVAGFVLLLLGLERFHKIVVWWCWQSVGMLRIWSFLHFCWVGFWFMLFVERLVFSETALREMVMVLLKKIDMDNNI